MCRCPDLGSVMMLVHPDSSCKQFLQSFGTTRTHDDRDWRRIYVRQLGDSTIQQEDGRHVNIAGAPKWVPWLSRAGKGSQLTLSSDWQRFQLTTNKECPRRAQLPWVWEYKRKQRKFPKKERERGGIFWLMSTLSIGKIFRKFPQDILIVIPLFYNTVEGEK